VASLEMHRANLIALRSYPGTGEEAGAHTDPAGRSDFLWRQHFLRADPEGALSRAAEAAERALRTDLDRPSRRRALLLLASARSALGDPMGEAEALADAAYREPDQARLWMLLVGAYRRAGRFAKAEAALRRGRAFRKEIDEAMKGRRLLQAGGDGGQRGRAAAVPVALLCGVLAGYGSARLLDAHSPPATHATGTRPNPGRGAKLTGQDLRGRDLRGQDLQDADLSGADLSGANLSRADMRRAYLVGASLQRAMLTRAWLAEANLEGAHLAGAELAAADLRGAILERADLADSNLTGAFLAHANLRGAHLRRARLREAELFGAYLHGAWLDSADLRGAWLARAVLEGATLTRADLTGAQLDLASLGGVRLHGARLAGADLRGACLAGLAGSCTAPGVSAQAGFQASAAKQHSVARSWTV
jgi:uncharacterized protein YjbI with pentapeptide repeats